MKKVNFSKAASKMITISKTKHLHITPHANHLTPTSSPLKYIALSSPEPYNSTNVTLKYSVDHGPSSAHSRLHPLKSCISTH